MKKKNKKGRQQNRRLATVKLEQGGRDQKRGSGIGKAIGYY